MKDNLAVRWWTPISLRAVASFGWISLMIALFMCGISWMRGDDTGLTTALMVVIANSVIVLILPEDVPARPVPEKFALFLVSGASMTVLSLSYIIHRAGSSVGLTMIDYWTAAPSILVGAAAVVAASRSSRWFMGKASTEEALKGLARSRKHSGAIIQTAKQIVLIHLAIFAKLPP